MDQNNYKKSRFLSIKMIVVYVVVIGAIIFCYQRFSTPKLSYAADSYQAVFLTNNQVYFGKLTELDSKYPVLTNVYYIQAFAAQDLSNAAKAGGQLQLVKLGSEIHQPQNVMYLNRSQ